jgi:hypothetical protein
MGTAVALGQPGNLRSKKISTRSPVVLEATSLVPHTFFVQGFDTSYYQLDAVNATLTWRRPLPADSVTVLYRVLPVKLNAVARRYLYDSVATAYIVKPRKRNTADNNVLNFGNLQYNGSFGRSLSFGNNQDAVFNSQLNLQLSGYIGDSIHISAAITDNNIPIQPDGTTQQLNEFDRILLQFSKRNWELSLGDIDLRQNESYFINFYKRLQGISYRQHIGRPGGTQQDFLVSGAIAKGKFTRNVFQGLEGNQGPYKLQGNNGELYFVVLANTEKVFIDGVQLQRGEDQDYIINYNTAEITFTPRRMITKDRRIQVEFEYADRNYLNSMIYATNTTTFRSRLAVTVSAYTNADAKNSPINQSLDDAQKQFLANIGDSITRAYYPIAQLDTFAAGKVLYKLYDTTYNGTTSRIYIYSTSPDSARYRLNFIEVGANKGNYVPLYNAANGSVYVWIQPVNGIPQGNYEPATFLVTPKKQQLVSIRTAYQVSKNTLLQTELAASSYNVNTFSPRDKSDDAGLAGKVNLQHSTQRFLLGNATTITTKAGYEYVHRNFRTIERLRPVEFSRDWGLPLLTAYTTEQLPSFALLMNDDKGNALNYNFAAYLRADGYRGYRNIVENAYNRNGWQWRGTFNLTNISQPGDKGYYFRPSAELSKTLYTLKKLSVGASYALEHNETRNRLTDSLATGAFSFHTIAAFIRTDVTRPNRYSFSYFTRSDRLPDGKGLLQADRSQNYNFQAELLQHAKHQFRLNVTYRKLNVQNKLSTSVPENSLLGRVEYAVKEWKGLLMGNTFYELGSGQEQKRNYTYIEVQAGRGEYTWNDYNNDGIQQLNEFEVALYQDQAKYIRVFTPTNTYIRANYTQFNYSISLNPRALIRPGTRNKWQQFASRFTFQSSLQTFTKTSGGSGDPTFNPFRRNISDTSLINLTYSTGNTLSFNRASAVWGADLTHATNAAKALLTYGTESRKTQEWNGRARFTFLRKYTLETIQRFGYNNLETPSFNNRNYHIRQYSAEQRFTYTYVTRLRLQFGYQYQQKQNSAEYGGENTSTQNLYLDSKFNAVNNTSLNARLTYSQIGFNGTTGTTVSYIMLDGLLPGSNLLWNIELTKRLLSNLELSLRYEGRKPAETHTIHIGQASIRALL